MRKTITIILALTMPFILKAQNKPRIITSGTIEFEKTINMFAVVKKKLNEPTPEVQKHYNNYLKSEPQFRVLKSTLTFNKDVTLFTPQPAPELYHWYYTPAADQLNVVHQDLGKNQTTIQKTYFERTYLVKDSLRKIKWKMTDETREIAGFKCRRANGLVLDSVYLVAFYTDEIHVPGGPEQFNGLPGMILGVVAQYENVRWFATKFTDATVDLKMLTPPKKGKVVNNKQLYDDLMKATNSFSEFTPLQMKGVLL
ncbi:GLPGLI family protein [Mucilaginibacter myungsuensis]|uniref:GLPGLI family protein n=1 Tax=Mucilaginibacter myungsuensis TaxID=649104 RepID=A0A929PWI0_9SPHI|nr:GLPGLI family protein [Mucilaginibacter myungsuensis]MBE9662106.1 GLPGLI family protein [Mucilaginibacter myungsuensis]MDN3599460.1 GLPGLI family protein [Mucilaginibacter myungsuensis]